MMPDELLIVKEYCPDIVKCIVMVKYRIYPEMYQEKYTPMRLKCTCMYNHPRIIECTESINRPRVRSVSVYKINPIAFNESI